MKRMLTAALVALLLAAPTAAAAATPAPSPTSTPVECDPDHERPAVWDQVTGEVILCESRGEGPAMGPDCELLGDCPPQLPMPPALEDAPDAPVAEPLEPVVHEQLAETGLTPVGGLLVAFALVAICLGCLALIADRREQLARRRREAGGVPGPTRHRTTYVDHPRTLRPRRT